MRPVRALLCLLYLSSATFSSHAENVGISHHGDIATSAPSPIDPATHLSPSVMALTRPESPVPAAPHKRSGYGLTSGMASSESTGIGAAIIGILLVIAMMCGGLWFIKRILGASLRTRSVIKMVDAVQVGAKERVVVLEIAGQWLVVGVASGQVTPIAGLPRQTPDVNAPLVPAANAAAAPDFSAWLRQTIEKHHGR